uniref:ATP synthase subunit a n=1 Tax=Protostelium mycophagum TaxID=472931 RepID=A0A290YM08_9EUKA|nr:ATPase subunit 6 [Protostelium mycophagum]
MFSPLEQFENHYLLSLNLVGDSGFGTLTTVSVVSLFNTILLLGVVWLGFSNPKVLLDNRAGVQTVVEAWWTTLAGVIRQQLGQEQRFTALFVWLFGWLALNNLVGLVPFNFTVTSHLCVTLFLALGFNLGFFFWGVWAHGVRFFGLFVPSGAPVFLLPLIVVIEVVSYLIRPISLALRLFANMMAGHTLVHIILGFAAGASTLGVALASVGIFAVTLLEAGIAVLQAYVFVVLCCIYTRDALEPGH